MTARVTPLKGPDAGVYYVEALSSYYLDADEPAGRWHGAGAASVGLRGTVADGGFLRVMAGLDPRTVGEVRLGSRYREGSVRGFDVTASAPKSVSVLFAIGDRRVRGEVLEAHDTAVAVMVGWLEGHATTRFRVDGEIVVVDAEGIIAASFRQHTSRALDPQVHTHLVVANKVRSPDGRWLALDARSLLVDQRTLSAIYHATLRSELTGRLGVTWQPVVNGIAELAHIPRVVVEEFSARTDQIARRVEVKIDRFVDTFDRQPTPRERWRLEREAVIDSRPAKIPGHNPRSLRTGWARQIHALGLDPQRVVTGAVGRVTARGLDERTAGRVLLDAVAVLSDKQSSWRPAELTREIAAALPAGVHIDAAVIGDTLDRLTRSAVAACCVDISRPSPDGARCRRDGRPVTEATTDRALTTPAILTQEERLLTWAQHRSTHQSLDSAGAVPLSAAGLTAPQAQTAAAVAGDAPLVLVVGPAGTGKTTALAPAVAHLHTHGRPVFGVAPSAAAAEVLGAETGVDADTLDKLLTEHSLHRPPGRRYDLPAGSTVIVDEAAMVPTDRLTRLAVVADQRGWRVALIGDPMQFAPVGRGGMFGLLIDTHGAIELDRVHRFTHPWERHASLRLRAGDPDTANLYHQHGRLHGGTTTRMHQQALDAWWNTRTRGATVLLAAPTTDTVTRLNHAAQERRITAGELDPRDRTTLTAAGYRLHVGDEIATRRNNRQLRTDRGLMIRNRDTWTIEHVHPNGDLTITGTNGRIRLPAHYTHTNVELAYAQTSHATQGRTVDHSILVLDTPTDLRGIYVPMTRGRHTNHAYITTTDQHTPTDIFAATITRNWIDQPAHTRQTQLAEHVLHRFRSLTDDELRHLHEQRTDLTDRLRRLNHELHQLPTSLRLTRHDHTRAITELQGQRARLVAAQDTLDRYDRPFRRRGHEGDIATARRLVGTLPDTIRSAANAVNDHAGVIADLERRLDHVRRLDTSHRPQWESRLSDIDTRLHDDPGQHLGRSAPTRTVEGLATLNARPRSATERHTEPDLGISL